MSETDHPRAPSSIPLAELRRWVGRAQRAGTGVELGYDPSPWFEDALSQVDTTRQADAEAGDTEAQLYHGHQLWIAGLCSEPGTPENSRLLQEGFSWMERAYENGNDPAGFRLASCLFKPDPANTLRNPEHAFSILEHIAQRNSGETVTPEQKCYARNAKESLYIWRQNYNFELHEERIQARRAFVEYIIRATCDMISVVWKPFQPYKFYIPTKLMPDENVLETYMEASLTRHWKIKAWGTMATVFFLVISIICSLATKEWILVFATPMLTFALFVFMITAVAMTTAYLRAKATALAVTTHRVIYRSGVFINIKVFDASFSRIQRADVEDLKIWHRFFKIASVRIVGADGSPFEIRNIYEPLKFQSQVNMMIARASK